MVVGSRTVVRDALLLCIAGAVAMVVELLFSSGGYLCIIHGGVMM